MRRIVVAAVVAAFTLSGCITVDGGAADDPSSTKPSSTESDTAEPSEPEFDKAAYFTIADKMGGVLGDLGDDPNRWRTLCAEVAEIAADGLALPDTPSERVNTEWDAAMMAYATADGTIGDCLTALETGQDHVVAATRAVKQDL